MGEWMTMLPYTVNGKELGVQEWQSDLFLHYNIETSYLPPHSDGCNT